MHLVYALDISGMEMHTNYIVLNKTYADTFELNRTKQNCIVSNEINIALSI